MKLGVDDFRRALDIIGDSAGTEAAIAAQFALDLAVTAQFQSDGIAMEPAEALRLLRLRIARHRATKLVSSTTIH
ncbi:MAG TPA: hypothetical protein VHX61_00805 [Rhizomicrobium sp.]|jgi:hypothetical protein|nr:hypothetical protein [Rhizomicrobium sp.]